MQRFHQRRRTQASELSRRAVVPDRGNALTLHRVQPGYFDRPWLKDNFRRS